MIFTEGEGESTMIGNKGGGIKVGRVGKYDDWEGSGWERIMIGDEENGGRKYDDRD